MNLHAPARRIANTTRARLVKQAEGGRVLLFGLGLGSLGLGSGGGSLATGGRGGSGSSRGGTSGSAGADAGKETLDVNAGGGLGEEAGPESLDIGDTSGVDDVLDGFSSHGNTLRGGIRKEGREREREREREGREQAASDWYVEGIW